MSVTDPGARLAALVAADPGPLTSEEALALAARVLAVPAHEVRSVAAHEGGVAVTTTDGVSLLWAPDDRPDGQGRTGLMAFSRMGRLAVWCPPALTDYDRLCDVPPVDVASVADCDAAEERLGAQLREVRRALDLVADPVGLERLGVADRQLEAAVRSVRNRRPVLAEEAARAARAAELARLAAEQVMFEDLVLEVTPVLEAFLADWHRMAAVREAAVAAGAPKRVGVGGAGGEFRGFLVNGPDGQTVASRYPVEQVPVFAAADRLCELLRGDWAGMVEAFRDLAGRAGR